MYENNEKSSKKSFFNKDYTRREFLKLSGKGVAGVTVTASLLSLMGCSKKDIEEGKVMTWATPTGLLVVNRDKCVGCQRCEFNCTLTNDGKVMPYISRLKMRDNLFFGTKIEEDFTHADGLYGNYKWGPETCKQCVDPWCGNACPVEAIYADEKTGARMVDAEKCIACGACVKACPWGLPTIDPVANVSTKCINCGACVAGCITGALSMNSWEDVATALANK